MKKSTADLVIKLLTGLTLIAIVAAVVFFDDLFLRGDTATSIDGSMWGEIDGFALIDDPISEMRIASLALLILRAGLGMMIFVHGYNKAFRGGRLAGTGRWFQSMGMRPGKVHAALAAFTEMGVGVLLVVGLLTTLAAAGLIALMVVAYWTVHRDKGFMITGEGWEYVALIAAMSLVCATVGPGLMSLDSELDIAYRLDGWTGFWVALLLGVGAGASQLLLFFRPPPPSTDS